MNGSVKAAIAKKRAEDLPASSDLVANHMFSEKYTACTRKAMNFKVMRCPIRYLSKSDVSLKTNSSITTKIY